MRGHQFGGHEHLLPRQATSSERGAYALLVAIHRGRVNVAVPGLQRPLHGLLGLTTGGHLPHAQAEHGHLGSARKLTSRLVTVEPARHKPAALRAASTARFAWSPRYVG